MIVLDLDDTLYLERDYALSGFRHVGAYVEGVEGFAGFAEACIRRFEAGERRTIFDSAALEVGLSLGEDLLDRLVDEYRSHKPRIELCPDAAAFLQRVSGPLGLITDGAAVSQWQKIDALGIRPFLSEIRVTGDWPPGFGKPHERAFVEMESATTAPTLWYIGDNPAKDFVTPKKRGWRTIQIWRPGGIHDPNPPGAAFAADTTVESFDEVDGMLATDSEARQR